VEDSWPPYADAQGNGLSKDIIQKAFDSVNVKVEFVTVPYARALRMAEFGKVHGAFNVTKQKSTTDKFNFGEVPILQAPASYYYPAASKLNFTTVADIPKGTTIALIIGYEYGNVYNIYRSRFDEVRVSNQKQIIQLLIRNRVDVAIMFDKVATYKLAEMGLSDNAIKKGKINHNSKIFVAFSKKKNTKNIIQKLDEGLIKIK